MKRQMMRAAAAALAIGLGLAPATAAAQDAVVTPDPTDAEIAAIVVAANAADSANGALALGRAADERVREFGRQMLEAHAAVNRQAVQLVGELGVTPVPSGTSRAIADGQAAKRTELATLSGAAFDAAYIENEVAYHESVLEAVDAVLIPGAENPRLRKTLEDVRPAFVAHLEQAKQLRDALGGERTPSDDGMDD